MAETIRKSASDAAKEYIIAQIEQGKLKTGDKLPNERQLSEQLNVSRVSLREAICSLTAEGILVSRQGAGTFVGSYNSEKMAKSAYLFARLDGSGLAHVLSVRRALEAESAWQAAQVADEDDKKAIAAALEQAEKSWDGESDRAFHMAVASAAGNPFLMGLLDTVSLCGKELWAFEGHPAQDVPTTLGYYRRLRAAIDGGDSQEAYSAMYEYLAWLTQYADL